MDKDWIDGVDLFAPLYGEGELAAGMAADAVEESSAIMAEMATFNVGQASIMEDLLIEWPGMVDDQINGSGTSAYSAAAEYLSEGTKFDAVEKAVSVGASIVDYYDAIQQAIDFFSSIFG
jgi:hypothetical protein